MGSMSSPPHRVLAAAAAAALGLATCTARPQGALAPSWSYLPAQDGVRAALYRYPSGRPGARRAVLLLPDVGGTRALYDDGGRGLAPYLASRGLEVFALEFRGAGRSDAPARGYAFADLLGDAEAALARALESHAEVVPVGCGLGGALGFALAARHPEKAPAVVGLQAAAALGPQSEPLAKVLAGAEGLAEWLDLPSLAAAPLFGPRTWFDVMLANDGGIPQGDRDRMRKEMLAPIPRALVLELARGVAGGRLELSGRDMREWVRGYTGRALLVIAPRDNWIHPELSTPWRDVLAPARTRVKVLSSVEGARRDYGHLGMLRAESAERDVFAPVYEFASEGAQ